MSVDQQYLRQLSVVVANTFGEGIEFNQLRCKFRITRGDYQTPNACDLRIYNLSTETQNNLATEEFTTVAIKAGYPGNFGLIFQGSIIQTRKGRVDQKDSYVDITAGDGDEAYNFAPISATIPAGAKPGSVAQALLQAFQKIASSQPIAQGYQPNFPQNGYIRGKVLYGMARNVCRDFAWAQGCKWSIQDGALTFIPFTSYIPGRVPIISPSTGLVGVPEQTQQGLSVRVLLNPNMRVGQCIKLQNTAINQLRFGLAPISLADNLLLQAELNPSNPQGLYYVMAANHTGDSRGNEWYTDMTCLAVDATIPPTSAVNALLTPAVAPAIERY